MRAHCRVDRSEWHNGESLTHSLTQSVRYVGIELLWQLKIFTLPLLILELKGVVPSLPSARSSSLRCLNREERDFDQMRRSVPRTGEVRRSLLNTSFSSEEILAAASTGETGAD